MQFIRDHTDVQQWQYVSTHHNPADNASRGFDSKNLSKIQRWFNGPAFLWSSEKTWLCDKQSIKPVSEDDPELKIKFQLNVVKADITVTSKLEMILKLDKDQKNNGSGTVCSKYIDKENN